RSSRPSTPLASPLALTGRIAAVTLSRRNAPGGTMARWLTEQTRASKDASGSQFAPQSRPVPPAGGVRLRRRDLGLSSFLVQPRPGRPPPTLPPVSDRRRMVAAAADHHDARSVSGLQPTAEHRFHQVRPHAVDRLRRVELRPRHGPAGLPLAA